MRWLQANEAVESLRRETQLYLPALSKRRGFSSSRVEHLLNRLVQAMPREECYLEVGTLEGRTLEAAAHANDGKTLIGCDPCEKYDMIPNELPANVTFIKGKWQDVLRIGLTSRVGLCFYDGDHSIEETAGFMMQVTEHLADEAVLVLDDWDRATVRTAALDIYDDRWQLLREMPSYGDGLTCPQDHFGYSFGVAVFGFRR